MKLKMLLTDTKEDANEKINMVIRNRKSTFLKISVLCKLIYRLNTIPIFHNALKNLGKII